MRRSLQRLLTVFVAGLATLVPLAGPASADPPDASALPTALDLTAAGAVAPQAARGPVTTAAVLGPFQLRFGHSDKCLDVAGGSGATTRLTQYACVGGARNEHWYLDVDSTGVWFQLRNRATGLCANLRGNGTVNGTQIIQYVCNANYLNEYFARTFNSAGPPGSYYWITPYIAQDKAVHQQGASQANNGPVSLWTRSATAKNTWIKLVAVS
jgi:hypothetical protein